MTNNEIIKALEICLNGDYTKSQILVCEKCPLADEGDCTDLLKQDALSLINRQKEEIEMLENGLAISKKEIRRYITSCKAVRDEAIKEFAERLEKKIFPLKM